MDDPDSTADTTSDTEDTVIDPGRRPGHVIKVDVGGSRPRGWVMTITYTVTVTNNGPAQATNVSLDDVLPVRGLTVGVGHAERGKCSWSAIRPGPIGTYEHDGASATLNIQATVDSRHRRLHDHEHGDQRRRWIKRTPTAPRTRPARRSPSTPTSILHVTKSVTTSTP